MVTCLGIDLAWAARNRTGLAVLDPAGRLVASTTVVPDDDLAAWVRAHVTGDVVVAIDAPVVVPNATGRRECEAELGRVFGAYDAGAHPTSRSRPYLDPPRAAVLAERFGWDVDPASRPGPGARVAVEVYPHPAMVTLFGLGRVLPYKHKRGRDLTTLRGATVALLDHLERVAGPTLQLDSSPRWAEIRGVVREARRKSELRAVEDEVDAVVCAYLAWLWLHGDPRMQVLGDVERGYVVVPAPPTVPPAPREPRAPRTPRASRGRVDVRAG